MSNQIQNPNDKREQPLPQEEEKLFSDEALDDDLDLEADIDDLPL